MYTPHVRVTLVLLYESNPSHPTNENEAYAIYAPKFRLRTIPGAPRRP